MREGCGEVQFGLSFSQNIVRCTSGVHSGTFILRDSFATLSGVSLRDYSLPCVGIPLGIHVANKGGCTELHHTDG